MPRRRSAPAWSERSHPRMFQAHPAAVPVFSVAGWRRSAETWQWVALMDPSPTAGAVRLVFRLRSRPTTTSRVLGPCQVPVLEQRLVAAKVVASVLPDRAKAFPSPRRNRTRVVSHCPRAPRRPQRPAVWPPVVRRLGDSMLVIDRRPKRIRGTRNRLRRQRRPPAGPGPALRPSSIEPARHTSSHHAPEIVNERLPRPKDVVRPLDATAIGVMQR